MYRKYFHLAGMTLQVDSELPFRVDTFAPKFDLFAIDAPGDDIIEISHHFSLPKETDFGRQKYKRPPWTIFQKGDQWVYLLETSVGSADSNIRQISFVSFDHTRVKNYNGALLHKAFLQGRLDSLTMTPTDQILFARLLADRDGCYLHSDGINMDGKGFLFVGHSGAGKSTIATLLQDKAEILCDDRMIVRKWPEGYVIHGNWSHGTLPIVSANAAPLRALFFLEQAEENSILPIDNRMDSISRLLGCLIKPMVTREWWEKMLTLIEDIADTVPCYRLRFDKSGKIYDVLQKL